MSAAGFNTPISPTKRPSRKRDQGDPAYGMPHVGLHPEIPGTCKTPRCGAVADKVNESSLLPGWVRAGVYGSTDPDRVWCSGLCAMYGVALAELRVKRPAGSARA